MCKPASRFSIALLLAGSAISAQAQGPFTRKVQQPAPVHGQVILRPVPMEGTHRSVAQPRTPQTQQNDWDLQWRRSPRLKPAARIRTTAASTPTKDVFADGDTDVFADGDAAQVNALRPTGRTPQLRPVVQSAWIAQQPQVEIVQTPSDELQLDEPSVPNFFTDPFGDDDESIAPPPPARRTPVQAPQEEMLFPPQAEPEFAPPRTEDQAPPNQLRSQFDQLNQPLRQPPAAPPQPSEAAPIPEQTPPAGDGPTLGDMLRDNEPDQGLNLPRSPRSQIEPPPEEYENPFQDRQRRVESGDRGSATPRWYETEGVNAGITCEELRSRIAEQTIDQVSLDISPPYRPDEIDIDRYEKLKAEFDEKQPERPWTSVDGRQLATGRLRDLAYEMAVIQNEQGEIERVPLARLSDPDLQYIAESWGLPSECQLEQVAYTPRDWSKMTMTWKASNLMHNPLYFEDVNLERYGHTHGPFLEPAIQTAHFFGSVVVLPYKMGVHTPKECIYPLGYYRPGNCAPWITQPIPLSTRGALTQAATMTGLFWLIP